MGRMYGDMKSFDVYLNQIARIKTEERRLLDGFSMNYYVKF